MSYHTSGRVILVLWLKKIVIFVPRKCPLRSSTPCVCKVCFYFIVTLFTRSLILVAALFVHFSLLLMTTIPRP